MAAAALAVAWAVEMELSIAVPVDRFPAIEGIPQVLDQTVRADQIPRCARHGNLRARAVVARVAHEDARWRGRY
eukprot:scaffold56865_cov71-Phaeocystis_antarctica.AAC.2